MFYFHKKQPKDSIASGEDPGPLLWFAGHRYYSSVFCDSCSPRFCTAWSPVAATMKDDGTTACNLLSGYASNRVLRNETSINCILTDTSQFHTYGLGGGIRGLWKTLFSAEWASQKFQKIMDLFFQDNAHKLQVTSAALESHLSNKNSSR